MSRVFEKKSEKKSILSEIIERLPALTALAPSPELFPKDTIDERLREQWGAPSEQCHCKLPEGLRMASYAPHTPISHTLFSPPSWEHLISEMAAGSIKMATARAAIQDHLDRRPILMYASGGQDTHYWRGSVRNDDAYVRKYKERIDAACSALDALDGQLLFFTGTVEWKGLEHKLLDAFAVAKHALSNWLKWARKRGHLEYIAVLECQESGNPHWHVLFKWVSRSFDVAKDSHARYYILNQGVGPAIRAAWKAGISKVFAVREVSAYGYIKKYLVKSMQSALTAKKPQTPEETVSVRKIILGTICPVVTKTRGLRISQGLRPFATARNAAPDDAALTLQTALAEESETPLRGERLENLLIKLSSPCMGAVWLLHKTARNHEFDDCENVYEPSNPEKEARFKREAIPLGCQGCIITEILRIGAPQAVQEFEELRIIGRSLRPNTDSSLAKMIDFFKRCDRDGI